MIKIDSVRKEDEHKVVIRTYDGEGGIILLVVTAGENGVRVVALDSNLKHVTKFRVAAGGSELTTLLPLVELV